MTDHKATASCLTTPVMHDLQSFQYMPLLEIIIVTRGSVFKGENGELINV
jgi:hypothetical protein